MKRALSAFDLTCLGIGAIIGAGIFALAGTAAAGEQAHATASLWKTPVLNFIQSYLTHAELVLGRPGAFVRLASTLARQGEVRALARLPSYALARTVWYARGVRDGARRYGGGA